MKLQKSLALLVLSYAAADRLDTLGRDINIDALDRLVSKLSEKFDSKLTSWYKTGLK